MGLQELVSSPKYLGTSDEHISALLSVLQDVQISFYLEELHFLVEKQVLKKIMLHVKKYFL